jgi:hypothetical protein
MGKFADIASGEVPRRRDVKFTTLRGAETSCDLVVLDGALYEECLRRATAKAIEAKVPAAEGSALFEFARACEIVALAAMDPEKPTERFFASVDEVKRGLDDERILMLFREHEILQDEHSPRKGKATVEELMGMVYDHALKEDEESLPFERYRPVLQRTFVRFLVDLHLTSSASKSLSTSPLSSSSGSDTATP